jgi:hypothetical protein
MMGKKTIKAFKTFKYRCPGCGADVGTYPQFLGFEIFGQKGYQCHVCGDTSVMLDELGEPITPESDDWIWVCDVYEDVKETYCGKEEQARLRRMMDWE